MNEFYLNGIDAFKLMLEGIKVEDKNKYIFYINFEKNLITHEDKDGNYSYVPYILFLKLYKYNNEYVFKENIEPSTFNEKRFGFYLNQETNITHLSNQITESLEKYKKTINETELYSVRLSIRKV